MTSAHGSTLNKPQVKSLREPTTNPLKIHYVCMHVLLKIRSPRCVTYFRDGGSRDVCQSVPGEGVKMVKNSVTYSMDGPSFMSNEILLQKVKVFRVDTAIFPSHLCTWSASSVAAGRFQGLF